MAITTRLYRAPILPPLPKKVDPEMKRWIESFTKSVGDAFRDIEDYMMPWTGLGRAVQVGVGAGFTLDEDGLILLLSSTTGAAVTSDATTAIADGTKTGQLLILINVGSFNITIKDNANTQCNSDLTIAPLGTLCFIFDGTQWLRFAFSLNN